MTRSDWRLLLLNFKNIILPSVPRYCSKQVEKLFEILLEIQWISYAEPWVQKFVGIRLRFLI